MSPVAVVGLGAMGARIAARLLCAGEAARRADLLITMVAGPPALRAITEGPDGIAAAASASLTVAEMSTVGPAAIAWLASELPAGTGLLDAPVLGSLAEAESGSLTILAGGRESHLARARPLLSRLGTLVHLGGLGTGATAKLVANATLFGVLGTLGEPVIFGIAREMLTGCQRVAVIGDHLIADIAGAKRAGLPAILVLTGITQRADLDRALIAPDVVLDSLAALPEAIGDASR